MLDVLNAIYLAGILLSSITMYPEGVTPVPARDAVVAMTWYREWWREDGNGKCSYKGVVAPYVRTWAVEENTGGTVVVHPPEPDKVAGYIAVINRKECKGKEPEVIFRAGEARSRKLLFGGQFHQMDAPMFFPAGDMLEAASQNKLPPWLPQVIQHLEKLSGKDEIAKNFVQLSANELNKLLPENTANKTLSSVTSSSSKSEVIFVPPVAEERPPSRDEVKLSVLDGKLRDLKTLNPKAEGRSRLLEEFTRHLDEYTKLVSLSSSPSSYESRVADYRAYQEELRSEKSSGEAERARVAAELDEEVRRNKEDIQAGRVVCKNPNASLGSRFDRNRPYTASWMVFVCHAERVVSQQ